VTVVDEFDWRHPDYAGVFAHRVRALNRIRANPEVLPGLKAYYRDHQAQFITDWGCTSDPRNVEIGLPVVVPFLLFPRQVEFVDWVVESWRNRRPGVTPKSRESGVSWLACALAATLCLFNDGMAIGFGSRKEEYVDKLGSPKALFWKVRQFVELLPVEFRGGFDGKRDAPHMRVHFRESGSIITGEAGDNIGRGDRAGIYFVDEAAYVEHPDLIEAALSQTTNCRIDVSTPNGLGGPFYTKVTKWPAERVFRFHWRDDPRKDQAWYDKQVEELDPVVVAQELDIDFAASVEGVLIPSSWVQAAIDADKVLGIEPSGDKFGALDVADEGRDRCAFVGAHGWLVEHLEEWSGKGDDIFGTVQRTFDICDKLKYGTFRYDADGLGAGVRGDARVINETRAERTTRLDAVAYRGSGEVQDPDKLVPGTNRTNADYFGNAKAQAWWALRHRFQYTHRVVEAFKSGKRIDELLGDLDKIIVIPKRLKLQGKLVEELSQPTYTLNGVGKIIVDKTPDGSTSPNLADALVIRYAKLRGGLRVSDTALARAGRRR